jgi:hypothetical protein
MIEESGFDSQQVQETFLRRIQLGSGIKSAFFLIDMAAPSLEVKQTKHKADYSVSCNVEINTWGYTSTFLTPLLSDA